MASASGQTSSSQTPPQIPDQYKNPAQELIDMNTTYCDQQEPQITGFEAEYEPIALMSSGNSKHDLGEALKKKAQAVWLDIEGVRGHKDLAWMFELDPALIKLPGDPEPTASQVENIIAIRNRFEAMRRRANQITVKITGSCRVSNLQQSYFPTQTW